MTLEFYLDEACENKMEVLTLEESFIEDMYGGRINNVVEVGKAVNKTIYLKNNDNEGIAIRSVDTGSPFMQIVPHNTQLGPGETTPALITFEAEESLIKELDSIEDPAKREARKRELLRPKITFETYRIFSIGS